MLSSKRSTRRSAAALPFSLDLELPKRCVHLWPSFLLVYVLKAATRLHTLLCRLLSKLLSQLRGNNNVAAADLALVSRPLDKPSMANSAPEKSSDKVVHGRLF